MADDKRSPLREQILERAKAHMASHAVRDIEVPEWGCTIYWTPVTLAERETVRRRGQSSLADAAAHIIFMKAIDSKGLQLFDLDDKRVRPHEQMSRGAEKP